MADQKNPNASTNRGSEEERHYDAQRKDWIRALTIAYNSPGSETMHIQLPWHEWVTKSTAQIGPEECRQFCWKDCAIYHNMYMGDFNSQELLDYVYQEWFPHRDRETDILFGSFFGKLLRFAPNVQVANIVSFHARLCGRLRLLQADVLEPEVRFPLQPGYGRPRKRGLYRLRDSFPDVFIFMDNGSWREQGVLFVCMDEHTALAYGVTEAVEGGLSREKLDVGAPSPACVFRLTLKQAMQAVVSKDEDRRRKRKEYNALFEENLGSEDEA